MTVLGSEIHLRLVMSPYVPTVHQNARLIYFGRKTYPSNHWHPRGMYGTKTVSYVILLQKLTTAHASILTVASWHGPLVQRLGGLSFSDSMWGTYQLAWIHESKSWPWNATLGQFQGQTNWSALLPPRAHFYSLSLVCSVHMDLWGLRHLSIWHQSADLITFWSNSCFIFMEYVFFCRSNPAVWCPGILWGVTLPMLSDVSPAHQMKARRSVDSVPKNPGRQFKQKSSFLILEVVRDIPVRAWNLLQIQLHLKVWTLVNGKRSGLSITGYVHPSRSSTSSLNDSGEINPK